MTPRLVLAAGALLMAAGVALGAFGAHALKGRIGADALSIWQTAVNYHAWHALGLVATAALMFQLPDLRALAIGAGLFIIGIVLFSGSLYALALNAPSGVGMITPFGGIAFIAGWLALAYGALQLGR